MTIQECYEIIGGDYNDIMARLRKEDRVLKFLAMFLNESCYEDLKNAIADENVDDAFRAAHTLKGVCNNMSFTDLSKSSVDVTEALRAKNLEEAKTYMPKLIEEYELIEKNIKALLEENDM